uniref:Uncharacterized protein n=1 Tax=Panagrolaimus sp. JU765 TaxID=591449 RepID=A0AC34Q8L9_9BILA
MARTEKRSEKGESGVGGVDPAIKKRTLHKVIPLAPKDKVTTVIKGKWYLDVEKAKKVVKNYRGSVDDDTEKKVFEATRGYDTKQLVERIQQLEKLVVEAGLNVPANKVDFRPFGGKGKGDHRTRTGAQIGYARHRRAQRERKREARKSLKDNAEPADETPDPTAGEQVRKHIVFSDTEDESSLNKAQAELPMGVQGEGLRTGDDEVTPPAPAPSASVRDVTSNLGRLGIGSAEEPITLEDGKEEKKKEGRERRPRVILPSKPGVKTPAKPKAPKKK